MFVSGTLGMSRFRVQALVELFACNDLSNMSRHFWALESYFDAKMGCLRESKELETISDKC